MARTDSQLNLRLPAELKALLEKAADENKRSVTAETVSRLEAGMPANVTIRDYFAAKALEALIVGRSWDHFKDEPAAMFLTWCKSSYALADLMLIERAK